MTSGALIRRSSLLLILVGLCVAAGSVALTSTQKSALVIKNVNAFDGESVIRGATVVVQDGRIVSVGKGVRPPADSEVVDGGGMTLLPGLIDAHTHETEGRPPLRQALMLGVTTDLEMFTVDPKFPAEMRREQAEGKASDRADLFSSGIGVTAPGGHGTEFGVPVPTITDPADAQAFVDARIAEGSDYIKIIYERGTTRHPFNNLSPETLRAVIAAAKRRGKLAVVHVSEQAYAREAIEAGADGLVHVYWVGRPDEELARLAKKRGVFVIPTLTVIQSVKGVPSGAALAADGRVAPFLLPDQRANLGRARDNATSGPEDSYAVARDTVRLLHKEGVTILAGSDCPNIGTAQGASLHRELQLLVEAGLTAIEALRATTSATADIFHLKDRGRLRPGLRADLLLVRGDPTQDISATRDIVRVWKEGLAVDRDAYRMELQARKTP